MKKLFKSIVTLSLLISGTLLFSQSAAAVWTPWKTELFGHTERVFTDDTNYYSGAKTVDWRAEKKGSGTLYYTADVYKKRSGGGLTDTNLVQRGYFKHSTPLKSFSVSEIRKRTEKGHTSFRSIATRMRRKTTISGRLYPRRFISSKGAAALLLLNI